MRARRVLIQLNRAKRCYAGPQPRGPRGHTGPAACRDAGRTTTAEHIFALRHALELYDVHQTKIAKCDAEIEQVMSVLNEARTTPREPLPAVRREEGRGNGFRADSLPEVRRAARQ